jgi:hypothetical protein
VITNDRCRPILRRTEREAGLCCLEEVSTFPESFCTLELDKRTGEKFCGQKSMHVMFLDETSWNDSGKGIESYTIRLIFQWLVGWLVILIQTTEQAALMN